MRFRKERDSLGSVNVPSDVYYGAQTQRAFENYPFCVSQKRSLLKAYAMIKKASALANMRLRVLEQKTGKAIVRAANEVIAGKHDKEFVVPPFQAGAGTSTNMNLNEVIANRANELLGGKRGSYKHVHPNDHVNRSQSSNDSFHAAAHVAVHLGLTKQLIPSLTSLHKTLRAKAKAFKPFVKTGRTHLQDALPITLGQEFSGYARSLQTEITALKSAADLLKELPLGGTAVGTGATAPKRFPETVVRELKKITKVGWKPADNYFHLLQQQTGELAVSSALRNTATVLKKIAGDLILLSSGPTAGLNELSLPKVQPGSSIMPGKINPSIPEMMNMVCFRVIGNDVTVAEAARSGQLELNVYSPVIAHTLLESIELLGNAAAVFERKCVRGIKPHKDVLQTHLEKNPVIATVLTPYLGYDHVARIVEEAYRSGKPVKQVILEKKLLPEHQLDLLLKRKKLI